MEAENGNRDDAADSGYRGGQRADAQLVRRVAVNDGEGDKEQRDHGRRLVAVRVRGYAELVAGGEERAGDDVHEGCDDEDQDEQRKSDEKAFGRLAHRVADNLAEGFSLMANRGEQRTEVLKSAEEDAADYAPKENGQPAEYGSQNRSVDRPGACDGREVMAHQNYGFRGHIVDAVFFRDCGRFPLGVDAPFFFEPSAVELIAEAQQHKG